VLASVLANGALLGRLLADSLPAVAYRTPAASYLAWLDFRALGWGDEPSARVLEGARVALSRGADFGEQGRGFARLNFACGPDMLRDAVGRIATLHRS
jgi:cystathionine beta-lyase